MSRKQWNLESKYESEGLKAAEGWPSSTVGLRSRSVMRVL